MKNKDIHLSFKDHITRDFLKQHLVYFTEDGEIIEKIDLIERKIQKLQKMLELAKASDAAKKLINLKGWTIFDISDYVEFDEHNRLFIGTREELGRLELVENIDDIPCEF